MNGTVHRMRDRPRRPWRAAYVGPDGRKRSKTFQRKVDAERWLRQYFPKGTDLSRHPRQDLDAVALTLNTRPRKALGWRTPAEALNQLLLSA